MDQPFCSPGRQENRQQQDVLGFRDGCYTHHQAGQRAPIPAAPLVGHGVDQAPQQEPRQRRHIAQRMPPVQNESFIRDSHQEKG